MVSKRNHQQRLLLSPRGGLSKAYIKGHLASACSDCAESRFTRFIDACCCLLMLTSSGIIKLNYRILDQIPNTRGHFQPRNWGPMAPKRPPLQTCGIPPGQNLSGKLPKNRGIDICINWSLNHSNLWSDTIANPWFRFRMILLCGLHSTTQT